MSTLAAYSKKDFSFFYPIPQGSDVCLTEGQTITPGTSILKSVSNVCRRVISLPSVLKKYPKSPQKYLTKKPGDRVKLGEPLVIKKKLFGRLQVLYTSPVDGVVASLSDSGTLVIEYLSGDQEFKANFSGQVVQIKKDYLIIKSRSVVIDMCNVYGTRGLGELKTIIGQDFYEQISKDFAASMVLTDMPLTARDLYKASACGVSGIIAFEFNHEIKELISKQDQNLDDRFRSSLVHLKAASPEAKQEIIKISQKNLGHTAVVSLEKNLLALLQ